MFLLDRDGEAAGTFSRHSPERREGVCRVTAKQTKRDICMSGLVFLSMH